MEISKCKKHAKDITSFLMQFLKHFLSSNLEALKSFPVSIHPVLRPFVSCHQQLCRFVLQLKSHQHLEAIVFAPRRLKFGMKVKCFCGCVCVGESMNTWMHVYVWL